MEGASVKSDSVGRPWGLVFSLVLATAAMVIYIAYHAGTETTNTIGDLAPFMIPHFSGIALVAAGILTEGKTRLVMAGTAGVLLMVLGFLAIFSFGLLLTVAGLSCFFEVGARSGRRVHHPQQ